MRAHNNARVDNAKDENEIWKIVNEISNPRSGEGITIIENNVKIVDEGKVAEIFNQFFVSKIKNLKDNIDPNYVEDPIARLKSKFEGKKLHFSLKTVTEEKVLKTIQGLKNKKSSGRDEVTQEQLKLGAEVLAIPI